MQWRRFQKHLLNFPTHCRDLDFKYDASMLNSAGAGDNCSISRGLCQSWLFVFFCRFFTSAGSGCVVSSTCFVARISSSSQMCWVFIWRRHSLFLDQLTNKLVQSCYLIKWVLSHHLVILQRHYQHCYRYLYYLLNTLQPDLECKDTSPTLLEKGEIKKRGRMCYTTEAPNDVSYKNSVGSLIK